MACRFAVIAGIEDARLVDQIERFHFRQHGRSARPYGG